MTLIDPNETPEARKARIDAYLARNSKATVCDLCDKKIRGKVTNIGDSIEVILVCDNCLHTKVYRR